MPPELQPVIEHLIRQVLDRLSLTSEGPKLAARVIAKLRDLVGDLPVSADHHHSEPYGLLRHSLEVALKMLEEFEKTLLADIPSNAAVFETPAGSPRWQYLCFLAGLGHDLGKLLDMDVRAGDRHWSPLHETYTEFLRHVETEPVLGWNENRVRGGHAQLSPWLMHHLLTPGDIEFVGVERLPQLTGALTGTHSGDQSIPLARLLSKLDQQNVEEAAPDWMTKRPDSKVNLFIRALRSLIYNGELRVNSPGAPVYVTEDKAAVVVPLSVFVAREFLKRENLKLPPNHRLYDLLAQSEVVEANEDRQCVQRIKVPGKHGPVELSALIFAPETILPGSIISTLPKFDFELRPEERQHTNATADGSQVTPTTALSSLG